MSSECSHVVEKWFGAPVSGEKLAAWLGSRDANYGEWLELGLESVKDGIMPPQVALSQLPKNLKDQDRTYAVSYQLISSAQGAPEAKVASDRRAVGRPALASEAAAPEKIMVIVADITERLRTEAVGRYQRELLELFQHIVRDKAGFIEFLTEAEELVRSLKSGEYGDLDHMKRLIHTLKGNTAIFGMHHISEICHELESTIAEEAGAPSVAVMTGLYQAWDQVRSDLGNLIGEQRENTIEIDDADCQAVIKAVRDGDGAESVVRMIESWRLEPTGKRLARIKQQIIALAERMGKSDVAVAIEPHDLRLSTEHFAPFWSALIHVLRNAVDHGIEDRELRRESGKAEQSLIKVSTKIDGERFVVTVEDDGPGVDWATLRAKAGKLGIAASVLEKTENLVFLPGVSSKASVTELSGRGFGMAAVRDACVALEGAVSISSEPGVGTRVSFVFPKNQAIYDGHAATLYKPGRKTKIVA
jgi:two-component system chemotaxis sensor kinase CheA